MNDLVRSVAEQFTADNGRHPEVIVQAPGRVNLIGEHTDYSLLPVLPVAIDRSVVVAGVALDAPRCEVTSLQRSPPALVSRQDPEVTAPWHRYVAGVIAELSDLAPDRGARLLLAGDLPGTGGLSSSSAVTMGLLFALDRLWDGSLSREALIARGIRAERHVGLEGGAMDQTVITSARAGAALRIDFVPPARRVVQLPADLRLIVAYSGQPAPKATTAQDDYNARVIACRLAALLLGASKGLLSEVASQTSDAAIACLPQRASANEVAARLRRSADELVLLTRGSLAVDQPLSVRAAARHVLREATRVDAAEQALIAADLPRFGALLDASHRSLRDDYQCSTPQLDTLCETMRQAGALGARLTGAGFGGWAMAAADASDLQRVLEAVRRIDPDPANSFEVAAAGGLRRFVLNGRTHVAEEAEG